MALPRVTIEGRVAADPELFFASSGTAVCKIRVGAFQKKKVDGEWVDDKACWLDVTCFKQMAMNAAESIQKGDSIVVTGKLETDSWTDDSGNKRSKIACIADEIAPSLRFRSVPHGSRVERSSGGGDDQWTNQDRTQPEDPPF